MFRAYTIEGDEKPPGMRGDDGVLIDLAEDTDDPVVEAGASLLRIWGVATTANPGASLPPAAAARAST